MLNTPKIFDAAIYVGFLIFVLSLPFGYSTVFLNLGMSLVLVGWVGRTILERKLGWHRTALDLPIALFLGLALVASFFAPHPATSSLGYFWKWLRAVLLFYAVVHCRLGHRWRHVVVAFILAGGISSALGLWYYANDAQLAMDFMGRMPLAYQAEMPDGNGYRISGELRAELRKHNMPLSPSAVFVPSKVPDEWRIEDAERERRYTIRKSETYLMVYMIEPRLTGTFKMPNDLGAYLALLLPLTLGYFVASIRACLSQSVGARWKRAHRWFSFALGTALVLMCANLALTLTRAAWVSVAVTAGFLFLVVVRARAGDSARDRPSRYGGRAVKWCFLLFLTAVTVVLSLFFIPRHIQTRFQTMLEHPAGFMGERPQWWQTSLELIRHYPLTGIGLGRFRYEYQLNGPPNQYNIPYHSHNIYLHIAVEHGIPSLFVFVWMLVIICRQVLAMRKANDFWGMGIFIGGSGSLLSALVYGLADNVLHHRSLLIFWFIVGLIFVVPRDGSVASGDTRLPE